MKKSFIVLICIIVACSKDVDSSTEVNNTTEESPTEQQSDNSNNQDNNNNQNNQNSNQDSDNLTFEFNYETVPSLPIHPEGLGYISINSKHYLIIPFGDLYGTTHDYLRIFEIDSVERIIRDKTFSIYDEIPEIGFSKGPLFVEDFDNDGIDDFFLVDHGKEEVVIDDRFEGDYLKFYYGSESGFIKDNTSEITDVKLFYHHADVGDFDLDGDLDIISQRWKSQTVEVPNGNTITLFKNLGNRNYEVIDLDNPPASVGSVLFSNIDNDPELEVLSFGYGGEGAIWSWDILENNIEIINQQLGDYLIHDVTEIENNNNSSIFIFPEDPYGEETPTLLSTDKCINLSSPNLINEFQGRDIYTIDLNNDNLKDLYMFSLGNGENSVSFQNSVLINMGNNEFQNPENINDTFNNSYTNENTGNRDEWYLPLKKTENGFLFFKFEEYSNSGYPINGKFIDLSFN